VHSTIFKLRHLSGSNNNNKHQQQQRCRRLQTTICRFLKTRQKARKIKSREPPRCRTPLTDGQKKDIYIYIYMFKKLRKSLNKSAEKVARRQRQQKLLIGSGGLTTKDNELKMP